MTKKPALMGLLVLPLAAIMGIVTGIFIAIAWHFSHDHAGYTPDELVWHFVPQLIAATMGFAILSAGAATVWNRLKRHR
jgi:hypothetical protein